MERDDVETDVENALIALVEGETSAVFSYSLIPGKPLNDGGLQATWNGWYALLRKLQTTYLVDREIYRIWRADPKLVDDTFQKQLRSAHYQITKRLWLIVINSTGV